MASANETPSPSSMWEAVERVNEVLRAQGGAVVQALPKKKNQADRYSYLSQPILDAVNQVFGPAGWEYQVQREDITVEGITRSDGDAMQATVGVVVELRWNGETCRRHAYGTNAQKEVGDALNAATSHAIGKALSRVGIGRDAYLGLLKEYAGQAAKGEQGEGGGRGARNAGPSGGASGGYIPRAPTLPKGQDVGRPADWVEKLDKRLSELAAGDVELLKGMTRVLTGFERDGQWGGFEQLKAFASRATDKDAWKADQAWFRAKQLGGEGVKNEALRLLGRPVGRQPGEEDVDAAGAA